MATLHMTYFEKLARDVQGTSSFVGEIGSKLRGAQITFTTTTAQANPIPKGVRLVRLLADADCFLAYGDSSEADPSAAATSALKLEANVVEYFGLDAQLVRGGNMKFAAYDGTS